MTNALDGAVARQTSRVVAGGESGRALREEYGLASEMLSHERTLVMEELSSMASLVATF